MYEQISANKRKTVLLIFLFVLLLSAVGLAVDYLVRRRPRRHRRRRGHRRRSRRSSPTSTATRSRCGWRTRCRPTRCSTPATTTSSRACASRAGCRSRGSTSSTIPRRTRSRPGATPSTPRSRSPPGLLEKMNRVELEGVLAHELSHIRNYDVLVMTIAVTMVGIIALLSDFFLRIMFWTGGRGGARRQQQQSARHRLRDPRLRAC